MVSFKSMNVDNGHYVQNDLVIINRYGNLVLFSCIGYKNYIQEIEKKIKKSTNIFISHVGSYNIKSKTFKSEKRKTKDADFYHLVGYKKDEIIENKNNSDDYFLNSHIIFYSKEEFNDKLYNCLYNNFAIPIIKDWIEYIKDKLIENSYIRSCIIYNCHEDMSIQAVSLYVRKKDIINIIVNGLKNKEINIKNMNTSSKLIKEIKGLDEYLNTFSSLLANKISKSFVPKFQSNKDKYCHRLNMISDYIYYTNGIELYKAQKNLIQSNVNHLKEQNTALIVSECGSGKTIMANSITYASAKKDGYNTIVMCPSHLVHKWEREILNEVPNSKVIIIKDIHDIIKNDSIIKNKKSFNLYIIISKEVAKLGYEERPAAIWSNSKKGFICPDCGQLLMKTERDPYNKRDFIKVKLNKLDFLTKNRNNQVCTSDKEKYDWKTHKYKDISCHTKLWSVVNPDKNDKWIKIGSEGWIWKDHLDSILNSLSKTSYKTRKETSLFVKLTEIKNQIKEGSYSISAPRKIAISKYIKKFYKGYIDFTIFDEVQNLKGNSLQGYAMMDFINCSKKVIGLTGTLLNGYADGIFYLLYRMMGNVLKEDDLSYYDVEEFSRRFGVVAETTKFSINTGKRKGGIKCKKLPGVSPLVFTKYLLDIASFLSLSDMSEGLPDYKEIPIGVDMDQELKDSYKILEEQFKNVIGRRGSNGFKVLGSLLQTLSVYPDQTDQPPIIHPDTGEVLITPNVLEDRYRNKELKLLEIVQQKKALGEKCLIYYQWTGRTELDKKLPKYLKENGIKSIVLKSNIKTEDREQWIKDNVDDTVDVMICNPQLIETGLDLLDFTTIIFYQIGYNVFTMRQASRRSYRLSQKHDIEVFFLYYKDSIQEQALSLMASKLQASMAIEGKFSEEGLRAMSNSEDLMTQIARSVVNGMKETIDTNKFNYITTKNNATEEKCIHNLIPFLYLQRKNKRIKNLEKDIFKKNISISNIL